MNKVVIQKTYDKAWEDHDKEVDRMEDIKDNSDLEETGTEELTHREWDLNEGSIPEGWEEV